LSTVAKIVTFGNSDFYLVDAHFGAGCFFLVGHAARDASCA
jgi:hypothetical protein